MKNIVSAKTSIEEEIVNLENRLKVCKQINEELTRLLSGNGQEIISNSNDAKVNLSEFSMSKYPNYPFEKRLSEKLKYLDTIHPRAWKSKNRVELMMKIENDGAGDRFKYISNDMKLLVQAGLYIAAKFNNANNTQFYCKPEWVDTNEKGQKFIKPEFAPDSNDFGNMPEQNRRIELIQWVTSKNI